MYILCSNLWKSSSVVGFIIFTRENNVTKPHQSIFKQLFNFHKKNYSNNIIGVKKELFFQ